MQNCARLRSISRCTVLTRAGRSHHGREGAAHGELACDGRPPWDTIYIRLDLEQQGGKITGKYAGDKLEGSLQGNLFHFLAKDDSGGTEAGDATLANGVLSGTVVETDADDKTHPEHYSFSATLLPASAAVAPSHRACDFLKIPTIWRQSLRSAEIGKMILHVWSRIDREKEIGVVSEWESGKLLRRTQGHNSNELLKMRNMS